MRIKYVLAGLFLLLGSTIIAPSTFAGGNMFSLFADNNGWANDSGYGRIIRVYLRPEFPCKGTEITFRFVDSRDGDYIMTGSGNSTFIMQEDRSLNECSIYAKMAVKDAGERKVEVEIKNVVLDENGNIKHLTGDTESIRVDFDGQHHDDNIDNGYGYRSSIQNPYRVLPTTPTQMPSSASTNYPTIVPSQNPTPIISSVPIADEQKTEELNKRINDLQDQLDQSKKKQTVLEQKINDLINFIKKLFPFLK